MGTMKYVVVKFNDEQEVEALCVACSYAAAESFIEELKDAKDDEHLDVCVWEYERVSKWLDN